MESLETNKDPMKGLDRVENIFKGTYTIGKGIMCCICLTVSIKLRRWSFCACPKRAIFPSSAPLENYKVKQNSNDGRFW